MIGVMLYQRTTLLVDVSYCNETLMVRSIEISSLNPLFDELNGTKSPSNTIKKQKNYMPLLVDIMNELGV